MREGSEGRHKEESEAGSGTKEGPGTFSFREGRLYLNICAGVPRVPSYTPLLMTPSVLGLKSQSAPGGVRFIQTH